MYDSLYEEFVCSIIGSCKWAIFYKAGKEEVIMLIFVLNIGVNLLNEV